MKKNQLKFLDEAGLFDLKVSSYSGGEFVSQNHRFVDFASTNYLGFDLSTHMRQKGIELTEKWGSLVPWSRMEADPEFFGTLEKRISKFLNCGEIHLSHTITLTNFSIIPNIVKKGIIFADEKLHTVVWEACRLARDHGAQIVRFRHQDLNHLEELLGQHRDIHPKMIAVDGVYSISTELAPISGLQALTDKFEAWLYVDDAHGFGILGENPTAENPYGVGGNGIINHFKGSHDRTFYVSSFGKAFCVYLAFATIPKLYKESIRATSLQYLFSGPPSPFAIGAVNGALDLNDQIGEMARLKIRKTVEYFIRGLRSLNLNISNHLLQPVVFLEIGTLPELMQVAEYMWKRGVMAGLRAYPVVPENSCGLRFAINAFHDTRHIDQTLEILNDIKNGALGSIKGNIA